MNAGSRDRTEAGATAGGSGGADGPDAASRPSLKSRVITTLRLDLLKLRLQTRMRRVKPFWAAYHLTEYRRLRGNARRYRELGIRKSVVAPVRHRDIQRPSEDVPWLDRPGAREALAAHPELATFPEKVREALPSWVEGGFLRLEGYFDPERIDAIDADVERLIGEGLLDSLTEGDRSMDTYRRSAAIADAVRDPELVRLLSFLLGREVVLYQTINFVYGSQQPPHSDSFHMTTEPKGYLVAIWVALEDAGPESGPVYYYPGSHRLPYVMTDDLRETGGSLLLIGEKDEAYGTKISEVIRDAGIEPVEFLAKKGDVLVWHANLLHGGRSIGVPGTTRKSLVAHYFARDVLCYHEIAERPALVRNASA